MKQKYDVVLYFYWVHTHTVNKIIALHKELEKDHDVLTIFGNDSQGISKETFASANSPFIKNSIPRPVKDCSEPVPLSVLFVKNSKDSL